MFACTQIDSRFPICSDYCKKNPHPTVWKFWPNNDIALKVEGHKQKCFLDCTSYYWNEQRGNPGWIFIENIYVAFKKINVSNLIYVLKIAVCRFSGKSTNLYKIREIHISPLTYPNHSAFYSIFRVIEQHWKRWLKCIFYCKVQSLNITVMSLS